jgi:hypothetical protein
MQKDPELKGFTIDELKIILLKMRIFQLGLSMMVANSLLPKEYNIFSLDGNVYRAFQGNQIGMAMCCFTYGRGFVD